MRKAQATDAASVDFAVQDAYKIKITAAPSVASKRHRTDQVQAHDGSRQQQIELSQIHVGVSPSCCLERGIEPCMRGGGVRTAPALGGSLAAEVARKASVTDGVWIGLRMTPSATCLAPADEAELDSLRVCHHSNCPFFKAVLIQDRPTELLDECN